jgi:predicted anti-sigma-YlaC factor YlaD
MNDMRNRECGDIRLHLVDRLRGDSGRLRDRLERHLSRCDECRDWAGFIEALDGILKESEPGARLGFERRLEAVADLAERRADPVRRQGRFLSSILGAAAAAVALFGWLLPPVQETLRGIFVFVLHSPVYVAVGSAIVLLVSTPLLLARRGNTPEQIS